MHPPSFLRSCGQVRAYVAKNDLWMLLGLFLGSVFLHVLPFFTYGAHPLGYDTGFYRRYLTQPFFSFPNAPVPGLGGDALIPRILLDTLRAISIPTDIILYGSFIFLTALLPVLLFVYIRPVLGKRGAGIAALLLIFSAVSYNAFWYLLWKNALGLCLILITFVALERKHLYGVLLLDVLIAFSHKTSAILYVVTLILLLILSRDRWKEIFLHIAVVGTVFLLSNISVVREVIVVRPQAVFLDWHTIILFSLPYLLLIGFGYRTFRSYPVPKTLVAFGLASLAFPLFHLPFYERIFIFLDVALVLFAAFGAEYLFRSIISERGTRPAYTEGAIVCIALGFLCGNLWNQFNALHPLVTSNELASITGAGALVPPEATLLTTSDEAPWYEGWTSSHVAAPGLLHDTHNLEEWNAFWISTSTPEKVAFLKSFPQPLYVSTLGSMDDLLGTVPPCLEHIAVHLYRSACK